MRVETAGIVGLGLIGASIGLRLKRGIVSRVVGMDVDQKAVELAFQRGAVDEAGTAHGLLRTADVVFVAVPPQVTVQAALQAARAMRTGSVLTDVASTKAGIIRELEERLPPGVRYVGGHPMAGSERRGAGAADAALLDGRAYIVTPTPRTDREAVSVITGLARQMGMRPVVLSPEDHDELVAQVSHLPYLVAAALVAAASDEAAQLSGPTFSGFARVAKSPVDLWTRICIENRTAIRRALERFRAELDRIEQALDDETELARALEKSQQRVTQ